jgi:hypothetical protein
MTEQPHTAENDAGRHRVSKSPEALYGPPRTLRKRRRCDGHLSDPHMIEAGQQVVWSSLPPHSDIGNTGWWHAAFCMDCAPAECVIPPGSSAAPTGDPT